MTSADACCASFDSSVGVMLTMSSVEKKASAATASFLRMVARVFGRKIRERVL